MLAIVLQFFEISPKILTIVFQLFEISSKMLTIVVHTVERCALTRHTCCEHVCSYQVPGSYQVDRYHGLLVLSRLNSGGHMD